MKGSYKMPVQEVKINQAQQSASDTVGSDKPFDQKPDFSFGNQQQQKPMYSFLDTGSMSTWQLGVNPQSKIVSGMKDAFEEFSKGLPNSIETKTIVIDNNNFTELQYSVVVLCSQAVNLAARPVAYHAYLIEATGNPINNDIRQVRGEQVELIRLPSDANDPILRKVVAEQVSGVYPNVPTFETPAEVIPRCFTMENAADKTNTWNVFMNGILACRREIDFRYNPSDFTLANVKKDTNLYVRAERCDEIAKDLTGLPCRADIRIETVARMKGSDPTEQFSLNKQKQAVINRINGFIDLMWIQKPHQNNVWGMPNQQQQQFNPMYQAMFVITNGMPEDNQSLTSQLLMLASTSVLTEDQRWTIGLMPRKGTGKKNSGGFDDISAIGFDANVEHNPDGIGKRVPGTDSDSFTLGDLNQLLASVANPGVLLAIDVPECGSTTWQQADFAAAADKVNSAIENIILAADYLTNGHFKAEWAKSPTKEICYNVGGRIFQGYYHDQKRQQTRDIRDLGYLAVLNMINGRDMNAVRRFSDSFTMTDADAPFELRMQWRKQIADQLSPTYTGWARRIAFSGHFIAALARACALAGLVLKPELPYTQETRDYRIPAGFVSNAAMLPVTTGLFNYSGIGGIDQNGTGFYNGSHTGYTNSGVRPQWTV